MTISNGTQITLYSINAVAGALITLYGKILSKRIEVIEDFSSGSNPTGQGLIYYTVDPSTTDANNPIWAGPFEIAPQTEPIILGDIASTHAPYGPSVSNGPGVVVGVGVTPALPFIQIKSSGTATVIRVTEFA